MKDKKNLILIAICAMLIVGLVIYTIIDDDVQDPSENYVSRAVVAKNVSLLFHSVDECMNQQENHFDKSVDEWYVPYMNKMYNDGYYTEKMIAPTPKTVTEYFTYADLNRLFINMGVVDKELLAYVNNNRASNKIINSEWSEIYGLMVEKLDVTNNVQKVELAIVGTPSNVETMKKWTCATTYGDLKFTGLSVDYYIDKKISAYMRNDELITICEVISEEVEYDNSWIITMDSGKIKAYIAGVVREFISTDKSSSYSNVVADISLIKGNLNAFNVKKDAITGKVLSSSDTEIELENQGVFLLAENVKVYRTFGTLSMLTSKDILVGYDIGQYFIEDGKIAAVVLDRDVDADNIRVLIMNNGFSSIYHDGVILSSSSGMTIKTGNNTYEIPANETITFSVNNDWLKNGRVKISSVGINGKIRIDSLNRGYGVPSYRGDLELNIYDGRIVIINELPVEKYLLSVVPSEMPYTYNIEALKAQAVCARSYAYKQIVANGYSKYGAHVDDSTNYQVYNNSNEQESTTQAVEETYGKVAMYNDEVITAYFFSTSCGSSTDSLVWGSEVPYAVGKMLVSSGAQLDLTKEETFDSFIRMSYDTFDSEYAWYRWNVELTLDEITSMVNASLGSLCSYSQSNVFVLQSDGTYKNQYVDYIGDVKKIEVGDRGTGGVLNYIVIYGSDCTVKITKELNIRKLFDLSNHEINRLNGSNTSFSMLPSAYAVFDPVVTDNLISGYNIIGGGYGHGVGLSQNGANYLGKNGSSYEEILKFFYTGIEVKKIY